MDRLLIYPPGTGGVQINTEDYKCLTPNQFLNDAIIEFYLKYLLLKLSEEKRETIHIFSTFFYQRLTSKSESDAGTDLTAAQKRHSSVKKWTKNVNLFEKDFIIIPINENDHWFVAIVCYPGLVEEQKKSDKIEGKPSKQKLRQLRLNFINGKLNKTAGKQSSNSFKKSCILIFDSLVGPSYARTIKDLREYLSCEFETKFGKTKRFDKDTIPGIVPKVPQQMNDTDCGLYVLQYVESFFKKPIQNYQPPIRGLETWFEDEVILKKRQQISDLINSLMIKYDKDVSIIPDIGFPIVKANKNHNRKRKKSNDKNILKHKKQRKK